MPQFPFTPVARAARHDGWTAERQIAFINALADCGCVADAARAAGMSVRSAYRLRAHPQAGSFRRAWESAMEWAIQLLQDAVLSRAIKGVPVPHYHQGKKVGEHRRYDERLAQFLLRTRAPAYYGRAAEKQELPIQSHHYAIALARAVLHMEAEAEDVRVALTAEEESRAGLVLDDVDVVYGAEAEAIDAADEAEERARLTAEGGQGGAGGEDGQAQ
ncbi:hypothetical protein OOT33_07660 [Sphingobium sp. DEHP117]|uniref:hypothetical protein n=1 Tax=Sphingobium sp. DEHP117 TaxID=2993436 RepID=UPI0027D6CCA4|nr:hypothetical protein [Sphingobium sp. DEHP117]MDQ4420309.1 hypothetical protein [Sphingobium sp. DEHP117]